MPALSHVKSNAVADAAGVATFWWGGSTATANATDLVRPSDWNSVHKGTYSLTGNTANAATASGTNVILSAAGEFSLRGSTATIVLSGKAPLSTWEPFPMMGGSTTLISVGLGGGSAPLTSASLSLFGFVLDEYLSAGIMNMAFSVQAQPITSEQLTIGCWMGIFTRGTGASSTTLSQIASASWGITFSNWGTAGINGWSMSYATKTDYTTYTTDTTDNLPVQCDTITGPRWFGFPVGKLMTPGMYWLGLMFTQSNDLNDACALLFSYVGAVVPPMFHIAAPLGSLTSAFSRDPDPRAHWYPGNGVWSSAGSVTGMPNTIAFTSITMTGGISPPYLFFYST